ncbi:hypothetical protein [Methylobacterium frigidaeris]|uniref:Uncharacterized protein n=1 Tax=Methylobacterium frigidaeris TaxID=2038277 RepID=A0AA37HAZ7_9HYPH|nr:hypothetical protein [Methylobacterium frigidaeris]PIK74134.1 hypothetical protein CS379_04175 [Methylobacterium frigidaeris]GJD62626.1 hypothetical protein MPEAHAMD_2782 [Methylobacterium frigidaeris]
MPPDPAPHADTAASWRRFAGLLLGAAGLLGLLVLAFVTALDPYGLRAGPERAPGAIMDLNQRFMYPQVVRGGTYDSAVFGTSTARLLDPQGLDRAFGGRFANLAMNAATPWEQTQLARLFLTRAPAKAVLFGLDAPWCEANADVRRLTFRAFPPWLYREPLAWTAFLHQWNQQSVEIAGRALLHRLGRMPARIRGDGYEVFTPPESHYDAARAAAHIHGDAPTPEVPAPEGDPATPALPWLDELLGLVPADALKIVAFMPVNVAAQPRPGSAGAAREAVCKARAAEIANRRGATLVDFRIPSVVTRDDANYWDALHYRLPIAARIVSGLRRAVDERRDDPDGFYRVLATPRAAEH